LTFRDHECFLVSYLKECLIYRGGGEIVMFHARERSATKDWPVDVGAEPANEKLETAKRNSAFANDPRWQLVERILITPDFERSPRLSEFLSHICRLYLEGRSSDINEQHLGEVIFGRTPGYDASADSIVRSHALRLRHRLEFYFGNEGAHESLQMEIPRGGYVPRFFDSDQENSAASGPPALPIATEIPNGPPAHDTAPAVLTLPERPPSRRGWVRAFVAGIAIGVVALSAAYSVVRLLPTTSRPRTADIDRQFWSQIFSSEGRTLIVPGDSGLVLYETVTGQDISLSDYIAGAHPEFHQNKILATTVTKQMADDLGSRRYTSIVDLDLVSRLSHLPKWTAEHAVTVFARDLSAADAARSNLILIGSRQANPWVSLVEPSMNFILTRASNGAFYFLNRHPQNGEAKEYRAQQESGDLGAADVYGDVAYLPNPGGRGMVLVLSGLWMSGTQSAGDFVLDDAKFSQWLKSIASTDGTIPPFEVLIATKNLQGSSAYSSIVAKRVPAH
jgi:hypothetical protein